VRPANITEEVCFTEGKIIYKLRSSYGGIGDVTFKNQKQNNKLFYTFIERRRLQ